ncbi:MAG: hypothetical protein E5V24_25965 [Mesorhizobium sp.]|nr:MAG: hypothetical protein E5V24_25965 [Mesorhizobium sp.]
MQQVLLWQGQDPGMPSALIRRFGSPETREESGFRKRPNASDKARTPWVTIKTNLTPRDNFVRHCPVYDDVGDTT